jgi:hypothetical protein
MNRLIRAIVLENQDARPLRVIRVVFDHNGRVQPVDHITHLDPVCGKFLVPMKRYANIAASHEGQNLF